MIVQESRVEFNYYYKNPQNRFTLIRTVMMMKQKRQLSFVKFSLQVLSNKIALPQVCNIKGLTHYTMLLLSL